MNGTNFLTRTPTKSAVRQEGTRVWTFSPKGIRPPAQGCCTRLPWERGRRVRQPQRGCGQASRDNTNQGIGPKGYRLVSSLRLSRGARRNPVGVAKIIAAIPQGS